MIEKMKAVCVVTDYARKEMLLDTLCELGVLHVAEKKSAQSAVIERFAARPRLLNDLCSTT